MHGIDLADLPRYVQDKATDTIRSVASGDIPITDMRRAPFDRSRLSIALTHDYRLLLVQEECGFRPVNVVSHEHYNAMLKNAAIKGW